MASKGGKKGDQFSSSQEKIIAAFQQLRMEQRAIAGKISELEGEKNEHIIVIDALKKVDPGRRCFRMIGGVLVERTVKDVLPALQHNSEQLTKLVERMMEQLIEKGKELNAFKLKHKIRIHDDSGPSDKANNTSSESKSEEDPSSQGVLVS